MSVIYLKEKGFSLLTVALKSCTQTYNLQGLNKQRNKTSNEIKPLCCCC